MTCLPTWREMNMDTSPEVEEKLFALWREATPAQKWDQMEAMNRTVRHLALMGLRQRYPKATPVELRRHLADQILGPELAARVYGPLLEKHES